jgi:hypothetical protein
LSCRGDGSGDKVALHSEALAGLSTYAGHATTRGRTQASRTRRSFCSRSARSWQDSRGRSMRGTGTCDQKSRPIRLVTCFFSTSFGTASPSWSVGSSRTPGFDRSRSAERTAMAPCARRASTVTEFDLLEIFPSQGLHIRTRQESWLICVARGASIGRIAPGNYFRGGQLLVGFLRTLRVAMGTRQIEQGIRAHPSPLPFP